MVKQLARDRDVVDRKSPLMSQETLQNNTGISAEPFLAKFASGALSERRPRPSPETILTFVERETTDDR